MGKRKLVRSERLGRLSFGYINFYVEHSDEIANWYYDKYPKLRDKLKKLVYNERENFSKLIDSTHWYSMPEDVMLMKMRGFIKKIITEYVENHPVNEDPRQLTFNF